MEWLQASEEGEPAPAEGEGTDAPKKDAKKDQLDAWRRENPIHEHEMDAHGQVVMDAEGEPVGKELLQVESRGRECFGAVELGWNGDREKSTKGSGIWTWTLRGDEDWHID